MRTDPPHPVVDCGKSQAPPPSPTREPEFYRNMRAEREYLGSCDASANRLYTNAEILQKLFSYYPSNSETLPKFQAINQAAKNFAEVVLQNCPDGADRRGVINEIRVARMLANAAIALNGLSL